MPTSQLSRKPNLRARIGPNQTVVFHSPIAIALKGVITAAASSESPKTGQSGGLVHTYLCDLLCGGCPILASH